MCECFKKYERLFGVSSVKRPNIETGRRVLVTSDIHGHLSHLKSVLFRADSSTDDVLIINGDLIEKVTDNLDSLRFVKELKKKHTVYLLSGNVDFWRVYAIQTLSAENSDKFIDSILNLCRWEGTSPFDEMAKELDIPLDTAGDALSAKEKFLSAFSGKIELFNERGLYCKEERQKRLALRQI